MVRILEVVRLGVSVGRGADVLEIVPRDRRFISGQPALSRRSGRSAGGEQDGAPERDERGDEFGKRGSQLDRVTC